MWKLETVLLVLCLIPQTTVAESQLVNRTILYDGPQKSITAPQYRKTGYSYFGGYYVQSKSCGHLHIEGTRRGGGVALAEHAAYSCKQTVVGIDFTNRAFIAFIDLVKDLKKEGDGTVVTFPVTRYLARVSASPVIYAEALSVVRPTNNKKLDTLAKVMERLANANQTIGQERYMDGTYTVEKLGPMKFDPEGYELEFPNGKGEKEVSLLNDEKISYNHITSGKDISVYPKPTELFKAITKTLEILNEGYDGLLAGSDVSKFKELIVDNAEVMSKELKEAIRLMRETRYHTIEMGWFVSQVGDLIAAIDDILKGDIGSEPGFMEILRLKKSS